MFKEIITRKPTVAKKLLFWFLAVTLLPLSIFGYVSYRNAITVMKKEVTNNLIAIADNKARVIENYIQEKERDVTALARTPTIIDATQKFKVVFQHGIDSPEYTSLDEELRPFLSYYQESFGYHDLFLISSDGDIVFTVIREDDFGTNVKSGPFRDTELTTVFKSAHNERKTRVSDFKYYSPSQEPAAFIAAPVLKEGEVIGVVVFQLENREAYALMQDYTGLGKTGETLIGSKIGNEAVFINPLRHDPQAAFTRKVAIGSTQALPIQKAVQGIEGSGLSIDYRGEEILAVWRYLPSPRWGMVVKIDSRESFAPVVSLRIWSIIFGMLTAFVVIVIALVLSKSISNPIQQLQKGAEIIGSGNLDHKINIASKDEIGQLSRAFDTMTDNLKRVTASRDELNRTTVELERSNMELQQIEQTLSRAHDVLEQKVEERTAKLKKSNKQLTAEITERKQVEARLKHTSEQLSMLLESLPIIPYTCKTGGNFEFTFISNRVEEITGYRANQCIEDLTFWVNHIHPDDRERLSLALPELSDNGECSYQYRFRVADGSYKWFHNIQRLTTYPDSTENQITGTLQDITEEKKLRQESEDRLQQVIQADKLASLGKIVAGVAHEINNPNSFIIYNLPLLEETWKAIEPILMGYVKTHPGWEVDGVCFDDISQDMKEIIEAIRSGSERINNVVANLKDYVRLHEVFDFKPVNVNDVVTKVLTMVESQIRRYGSKKVLHLANTLPEIPGDFHKLEQVLVNLLVNATDALKERNDGKITVSTRYLPGLGTVLIEIEDNGEGMDPVTIDRIFEPFYTTRLETGGTGLGLSVSYSLIKEHNGTIGILSRKGIGSRFTVFLPVNKEVELKLSPLILCINYDDEFVDELRISSGKYANGFLDPASNPERVITYLEEHPEVDTVLLNTMQSERDDTLNLADEIKKRFPLLVLILCSNNQTIHQKGKRSTQPDYLINKPCTMNKILEMINTLGRQKL